MPDILIELLRRFETRKSYIVLLASFGFIVGIIIHSFLNYKLNFFWIYNLLLLFGFLIFIFWQDKKIRLILLGIFFIILGFSRFNIDVKSNIELSSFWDKESEISGVIISEPINKIDKQQLIIAPNNIKKEKILLATNLYPKYNFGDSISFNCKLQKPIIFPDFDYAKYLSIQNIYAVCYYPKIFITNDQVKLSKYVKIKILIISNILKFKNYLINKINIILNEPLASFLSGLILGARNAIPENLLQNFNRTGTTHIIAISGWNITFLGRIFLPILFLLGLKRGRAFYVMIVVIFLYCLLVGFGAPVVRAAIMGIIALWAQKSSRYNHAGRALLYSIVIMLLINTYIIYDVGFWLSVSATFGLIYFSAIARKTFYLYKIKNEVLRESLETTISAIIFTLPISAYIFGYISLWALPVNMIVLPFMAIVIVISLISLILSIFITNTLMVAILFLPTASLLSFIISIINFFGSFDFGYLKLKINFLLMLFLYLILIIFTINKLQSEKE